MKEIKESFKNISKLYNNGKPHSLACKELVINALTKLKKTSTYEYYGDFNGKPNIRYYAYISGGEVSRPIRDEIYYLEPSTFEKEYDDLIASFNIPPSHWGSVEKERANNVVYTGVMAIACCYDIWQRGSRKTPGTFFEIFMAGILKEYLADYYFSKHISLTELAPISDLNDSISSEIKTEVHLLDDDDDEEEEEESASSVSTDLVITNVKTGLGLVIPLKITTRERIVQPFAHQRILDSAFGIGKFTSFLACISETQLDKKKNKVNQICVPGTVKLFQKYLAPMAGMYYCDIPQRYNAKDMQSIIPVKTLGDLFVDSYYFFKN